MICVFTDLYCLLNYCLFQLKKSYLVYSLTLKGQAVMTKGEIILPLPTSIRELEKAEAEKRKQALADLKS